MPAPKLNFVPERLLGEKPNGNGYWTLTILKSNNTLYFPSDMVHALEMEGKYFRLFADVEHKAIGWIETKGQLDELNDARLAKPNKQSGAVLFGVGKILKALGYELKESLTGLRVQTYTSPLVKGDISYVILPAIERPYAGKEKESADGQ